MRKLIALVGLLLAVNVAVGQEKVLPRAAKETSKSSKASEARLQLDQKLAELKTLQAEIERLRRAAGAEPQQIMVQVQIMKVSRTRLEELGHDLSEGGVAGLLNRDGKPLLESDKRQAEKKSKSVGLQRIDSATLETSSRCKAVIDAWKKEGGVVEVVGEPTVVTVSGRPVFWHVGGAFPILVPAGGGAVATKLQPYGAQLDAVPLLLEEGRVRLELRARLSEIDESRTVAFKEVTVPGLRVREIDTGVELKPGQTFAVSGHRQFAARNEKRSWSLRRDDTLEEIELLVLAKVELVDAQLPLEE